jgi:hypothetical protein
MCSREIAHAQAEVETAISAPGELVMGVPRRPVMGADIENQLGYSKNSGTPRGGGSSKKDAYASQQRSSSRSSRSRSESRGRIPDLELDASASSQRRSASQHSGSKKTSSSSKGAARSATKK